MKHIGTAWGPRSTTAQDRSQPARGLIRGLVCAIGFFLLPALAGCIWGQYFELGWEEEVQLHDGRVILVHVTHTFERTSSWRRFDTALHRDTELRFDAGDGKGTVTQLFKSFSPIFLDQYEGTWYAVLDGGYVKRSRELPGQDWGDADGPYGQWAVRLEEGKWKPISMRQLPPVFQKPNMLVLHGSVKEIAEFDGTRATLGQKKSWLSLHPPDYADARLTRPIDKGVAGDRSLQK